MGTSLETESPGPGWACGSECLVPFPPVLRSQIPAPPTCSYLFSQQSHKTLSVVSWHMCGGLTSISLFSPTSFSFFTHQAGNFQVLLFASLFNYKSHL